MEITQFTYFQQSGGMDLEPISAEITYGLERITMFLGLSRSVYNIDWVPDGVDYGQVRHQDEVEFSKYYFEIADVDFLRQRFDGHEKEASTLSRSRARSARLRVGPQVLPSLQRSRLSGSGFGHRASGLDQTSSESRGGLCSCLCGPPGATGFPSVGEG